jgi:hypothetical protein
MFAPVSIEVVRFVQWLYEEGPSPDAVTREKLLAEYETWNYVHEAEWDTILHDMEKEAASS